MLENESGVGLIYWPGLEPLFAVEDLQITSLEVEVEAYWLANDDPSQPFLPDHRALERIAKLPQTKVIHGVGAPLGTYHRPNPAHLKAMLESIRLLDAKWYSEHLAFNRVHSRQVEYSTGFLLPPLQTETGAAMAARNIHQVREVIGLPVAVETGVNYLRRQPWELDDGLFTDRVSKLADCDLLLDLHNAWTNERNGRQSVRKFLAQIDPARVREIHLAGGFEYQGFWLDAHSGLVPDEVMKLAHEVVPRLPNLRAIHIEVLPQFISRLDLSALQVQIQAMHRIWETRGSRTEDWYSPDADTQTRKPAPVNCTPVSWENTLGALVAGKACTVDADWSAALARDPGIPLFTDLARTFRAGVVVEHLKMSSRYLMLYLGQEVYRRLLNDFWREHPPKPFVAKECEGFAAWLQTKGPELPHLRTLLAYDLALMDLEADDQPRLVSFDCEPLGLLRALGAGTLPERVEPGIYELELTPGSISADLTPTD